MSYQKFYDPTDINNKVRWYSHNHGVRFTFDNGYSVSIIPGSDGDCMECAIFNPSGEMETDEHGFEFIMMQPDRLSSLLADVQSRTDQNEIFGLKPTDTFTD